MATKTEKLLAALLQRGYKEVEHIANATCLHGVTPHNGKEIWLWLDKVGGARYSRTSKKGESLALPAATVRLVLEGKPSKLLGAAHA